MENLKAKYIKEEFQHIVESYIQNIELEFKHHWNSWEIILSEKEKHEVISSLIARQITITIHFASASSNWTGDFAPIILRSLADNYINLAWILKDPLERSRKFIYYGIGREKLNLEHRKIEMIDEGLDPESDEIIKYSTEWINFHQYDFLTNVDLSSWSAKSVFQMAEEADCRDFYNLVYQPFSSATHNMWNHVGKYNVMLSDNPLHNHLLVPKVNHPEIHYDYLELAAKYVDKMLNSFHEKFEIKRCEINSYNELNRMIDEMIENFKNMDDSVLTTTSGN